MEGQGGQGGGRKWEGGMYTGDVQYCRLLHYTADRHFCCHIVRFGKSQPSLLSFTHQQAMQLSKYTNLVILSLLHRFDTVQRDIGSEVLVQSESLSERHSSLIPVVYTILCCKHTVHQPLSHTIHT